MVDALQSIGSNPFAVTQKPQVQQIQQLQQQKQLFQTEKAQTATNPQESPKSMENKIVDVDKQIQQLQQQIATTQSYMK